MERPPREETELRHQVRTIRRPHASIVYHSEANEWRAEH